MTATPLPHAAGHASLTVVAPCFVLTVTLGLLSDGAYHDDDLTHFLMARWVRWYPEYLLHIWGRPGLTVPLAAVAWIGDPGVAWHAARLLSAVITAVTALLAAQTAARLGIRNAWLVGLACYAQPLAVLLAGTTLTENFAAFYLTAAVALLVAKRPLSASAVFSLILVTRHEAVILLPIWWLGLLGARVSRARHLLACFLTIGCPLVHNLAFRLVFDRWPVGVFLQSHGSTEYPALGWLSYVPQALFAVPPAVGGLALVGGMALLHRRRPMIPALAGLFFLTHVAVKALGVFASGGYGRFMVTVAPLIAIMAVAGFNEMLKRRDKLRSTDARWLMFGAVWLVGLAAFEVEQRAGRIILEDDRLLWWLRAVGGVMLALCLLSTSAAGGRRCAVASWASPHRWKHRLQTCAAVLGRTRKITAAALAATCLLQWAYVVRPLRLKEGAVRIQETVEWLRDQHLDNGPIFATNPWFAYFLGLVEHPRAHKDARLLASMPIGTVFIWDSRYSASDFHGLGLQTFQDDDRYQPLRTFGSEAPRGIALHVFRKIAETPVPREPRQSYPPNLMSTEGPFRGMYYIRPGVARTLTPALSLEGRGECGRGAPVDAPGAQPTRDEPARWPGG